MRSAPRSTPFKKVSIQDVRSYWDSRPCNIRHSPAPVGTREYFDEVEARKYFVEPHIPGFAQFERWAGKRVLEVGCGIGTDTINFARAGARVTAIDVSGESLDLARRRAEVFGLEEEIRFIEADAERLSGYVEPFAYDLVYSFGVIHHSPYPERIVEEIRRHFVGPGSLLKVMVYNRRSWKTIRILLQSLGAFWRLDELIARSSEAQTGCPVTYTYTPRSVRELLKGFDIQERFVDHVFPYRVQDYVEYRYVKEWQFRVMPQPVFRALERTLGWHLCVTAIPSAS